MLKKIGRAAALLTLALAMAVAFQLGRRAANAARRRHGAFQPLTTLIAAARGGAAGDGGAVQDADEDVPPLYILEKVLSLVQHNFVEPGGDDNARLTRGEVGAMLAFLDDPHTALLDAAERMDAEDALKGKYHGIGAALTVTKTMQQDVDYRYLTVLDAVPGGPAARAGLKPGDRITHIDGRYVINHSVLYDYQRITDEKTTDAAKKDELDKLAARVKDAYTLTKALDALCAGQDKTLKLTIQRGADAAPITVPVQTAVTEVEPVRFTVQANRVGHLRIRQFNATATTQFQDILARRLAGLKGLVVDLRGNPGGAQAEPNTGADAYDSARKLIALLTRGGTIGQIQHRPSHMDALIVDAAPHRGVPRLDVLVDEGTANLAEMVAAALRDSGHARLIGSRTFGDDVLQRFIVLSNGCGLEIASGHLFTSRGKDLAMGVVPDVVATSGGVGDTALNLALTDLGAG